MLINLRNALMAGRRLPYDNEIEFLESTGTQYIDAGFATTGVGLEVDVLCERTSSYTNEMGIVGRTVGDGFELYSQNAVCGLWNGPSGRSVTSSVSFTANTPHQIHAAISSTGAILAVDGTTNTATFKPTSGTTGNCLVFTHKKQYWFIGRIYSCKIWQNGVLVRDYIPVRKGTVGYLYDRVSGKLFGNAGTGDFVCGPDVVPVEWLQTDGAAYIDTGLEMADGHEVRAEHYFKRSTTRQLMGSNASRQYYGITSDGYVEFGLLGTYKSTVSVDETKKYLISYAAANGNNTGSVYEGGALLWSSSGAYYGFSNSFQIFRNPGVSRYPFGSGNKIVTFKHLVNGAAIQNLISVRVGTEGAMMDVLTRRIYRNAGTGAFTYGNDLKYPIPAE